MFGRACNAKSSVTQASVWVTYLLLALGIVAPVVCVVWLVQRTVENEKALARELVKGAREQNLEDAESLVRLTVMGLIPDETNAGVRYRLYSRPIWVDGEESQQTSEKLARIRGALSGLDPLAAQEQLSGYLEDESVSRMRMLGGRLLGPILIEIGLRTGGEEGVVTAAFGEAADRFILSLEAGEINQRQLSYLIREYGHFSKSEAIERLLDRQELLNYWLRGGKTEASVAYGDGYFSLLGPDRNEVYVFSPAAVVASCERMESIRSGRYRVVLKEELTTEGRELRAPLDFLAIVEGAGAVPELPGSGSKAVSYFWIGGIVLGLSVLSGVAIVFSVRRQASVTQLKDDLVATVTHELKTPVASIRLLVDTLMNEERRGEVDTKGYVELISRENQRLGRLIDNFLSFSRMERSKGRFDIVPIAPSDVARSAEEAFRERFQGRDFELSVETGNNLRPIMGDLNALSTVLGNLLENAFKYGGERRVIVLRVRDVVVGVEFSVQDFGRGIAKRNQTKVFRKFFQVKSGLGSRQASAGATDGSVGLGLSIVDFIVSRHSGTVSLVSELGKGSVFKVRIPYA